MGSIARSQARRQGGRQIDGFHVGRRQSRKKRRDYRVGFFLKGG